MTNPHASVNVPAELQVTIDRIITAMASHGITLSDDPTGRVARCSLNDLNVLFVLLDSVALVRTDVETDAAADTTDATLYIVANQVNSALLSARSLVVNRGANLVVRTEAEVPCAAGLSDDQVASALKRAVDGVIQGQNAMKVMTDQLIDKLADATEGSDED